MAGTFIPMTCNLCGQVWDRVNPPPCAGTHSEQDWDDWRTAHGVALQDWTKWTPVQSDEMTTAIAPAAAPAPPEPAAPEPATAGPPRLSSGPKKR
jgi:hypothetical protein